MKYHGVPTMNRHDLYARASILPVEKSRTCICLSRQEIRRVYPTRHVHLHSMKQKTVNFRYEP